jgi:hypothetical protein
MSGESSVCPGSVSVPLAYSNQNWAIVPSGLGDGNLSVGLTIGTNGLMVGEHSGNILVSRLSYTVSIEDWVHVAVVYRTDSIFLYLNGDLVRDRQIHCSTNLKCLAVGLTGYYYASDFQGNMDEFRLWDVPLTPEQIRDLKNKKLVNQVDGLRYYVSFDHRKFERALGDLGDAEMTVNGNITAENNIKKGNWGLYTEESDPVNDDIFVSDTVIICDGQTVGNDHMVSYYPFNGNADDLGLSGADGIVNGAVLTEDRDGNQNSAYYFDGVDDYISIPDSLHITNNFTISFWAYNESDGSTSNIICDGGSLHGGNDFLMNFRGDEIGLRADKSGKSLNYEYSSPAALTGLDIINKWRHYTWAMSPAYSKIYLDGVEIAHIDIAGTNLGYHDANSVIGARQVWGSPDNFFKGKIDDVRIYDKELDADQIYAIYQGASPQHSSIEIPVQVKELVAADNIISYQFDLQYDPDILIYGGYDIAGTISEGGIATVNSGLPGTLSISYMNTSVLTGSGDLIRINFNPLANDTTHISISNAYLNNNGAQTLRPGEIILRENDPPSAEITYSDSMVRYTDVLLITASFDEPMLEDNPVFLNFSGSVDLSNLQMNRVNEVTYTYEYTVPKASGEVIVKLGNGTDLWGNVVDSVPLSGGAFSIIEFTPGDVDDDGRILAYDAALTLQYSVGIDPLPLVDPLPWENWRVLTANVDDIGDVTANDAALILQYSAGLINTFFNTKKSLQQGFVSVQFLERKIVFISYGDLVGLNVSVNNEGQFLGEPKVLVDGFMLATNIATDNYRLGLCRTNSLKNGTEFLEIPVLNSGQVTLDMLVNSEHYSMDLNLVTNIETAYSEGLLIYPNPVKEKVYIKFNEKTLSEGCLLKIFNPTGALIHAQQLETSLQELNVSDWSEGLYILKLVDKDGSLKEVRKLVLCR